MVDKRTPAAVPTLVLAALLCLFALQHSVSAQSGPQPARQPVSEAGRLVLSETDRCPVCAMFPARRPEAAAALTMAGGETFYFCSNACLLRAWLRPAAYLGATRDRIERVVVQDYFSGQPVDGRSATWVAGSDVLGPMGPAVVALGDAAQLDTFTQRHGGTVVFTFDQVDDALWHRIRGRALPPPAGGSE